MAKSATHAFAPHPGTGDAYFLVKDKYLPVACAECAQSPNGCRHDSATFDCTNPESGGNLVVRKIELEVKANDTMAYALCNDVEGKCGYECQRFSHTTPVGIGQEKVCAGCNMAPAPSIYRRTTNDYDYWDYNGAALLGDQGQGLWYSLRKEDENVFYRNVKIVKVINADCQARALDAAVRARGESCFSGCPEPTNTSSVCWVNCFFETVIGKGHNTTTRPEGGMTPGEVTAAWLTGFETDDTTKGGCPACPETGDCPPPSAVAARSVRRASPRAVGSSLGGVAAPPPPAAVEQAA